MPTPQSILVFLALTLTPGLGRSISQIPLQVNESHARKVITDELSSSIQTELQAHNFTGLSLGVVLPNGETIFNPASCSKAFVSASLGILMQDFADGKNKSALPERITEFTWDTKMRRDLLPDEWMTEDEWTTSKASLKDLLSHVTGLPAWTRWVLFACGLSARLDPSNEVFALRMSYANATNSKRKMYITGAYIVSKYSGSSYRDFVAERILAPLRMASSTLYPDRAFETGRFTQSWTASRRRIPFFMPEHTAELIAGAGGVMSTVEDMALWVKMLLNAGVDVRSNATIIPRTTFDLATSAISVARNQGTALSSIAGYGLGWVRLSYRGHELVQHNGGAPGVATIVDLYPHDGFGLVLLANTAGPSVMRTIANAVANRMLKLPKVAVEAVEEPVPVTQSEQLERPPSHNVSFTGTYSNAGYGNFTLCSPLFPTSADCLQVIQDFRTVDSAACKPTPSADLYSAWPRFWGSHLHLSPGFGADRTPFEDVASETFEAKFMLDSEGGKVAGLGMYVARRESWRVKKGGSVRDTADVWFEKL
ncbi:beta-lactamase/transpeptidase-like protein [Mycena polygramma]|nr:beta-lactamase/transpeptidase-like protein [Mycena polygramma]